MKSITLLSLLFLCTAFCCVAQPVPADSTAKTVKQPINKKKFATLYVYRPKRTQRFFVSYALHISNSAIPDSILHTIENGDYYTIKLYTEGKTTLSAKVEKAASVEINVAYGQTYYLKCTVSMGNYAGNPKLELMDTEKGQKEFDKM